MSEWNNFLKKNKGLGLSMSQLSKKYCKDKLNSKIKINMDEMKKGRYSSRQQAIAVSYSQVKNRFPMCAKIFK